MIVIKLGRWDNAADEKFVYDRIYAKWCWTPFCNRERRWR
jgi:hypothetical protein